MVRKSLPNKFFILYCIFILVVIVLINSGSNAVTTWIENSPMDHRTCIAIDAGHGGIDGGAVSISGVPESQINLQIAQRLNDLFHLLGYQTLMLRNTDTSLHTDGSTIGAQKISDLKHRVQIIGNSSASLLISIHQNTFSDKQYRGAQVFYHSDEMSITIANQLQDALIQTLNPGSNRKPKVAKGIYLMEHIFCPGILVECGFLTNAQEEALLRDDTYQKQLCSVIATTISAALA